MRRKVDAVCKSESSFVFELVVNFIQAWCTATISASIDRKHSWRINQEPIQHPYPLLVVRSPNGCLAPRMNELHVQQLLLYLWVQHIHLQPPLHLSHSPRSTPIFRTSPFHLRWQVVSIIFCKSLQNKTLLERFGVTRILKNSFPKDYSNLKAVV